MKEKREKQGIMPTGQNVRLSSEQMNQYLKKFPKSERKQHTYIDPKWV